MVATLALDEGGQGALFVGVFLWVLLVFRRVRAFRRVWGFSSDYAPTRVEDFLAGDFKLDASITSLTSRTSCTRCTRNFAQDGGGGEFAVGQEDADEATCHEVEDLLFGVGQILRNDACRDDGVVVRHFRRIEDALRLFQRLATNGFDELRIDRLSEELRLVETVHGLRTLGVDVVGEVLCVDTRVGGVLFLVERLDEVQRHLGRESELAVAIDL